MLRPPAVPPQSVPNRSPRIFADLIDIARGYSLKIRDADHRAALVADSKYYGLKGLMHRLFVHNISYNAVRNVTEIIMRLEDLHKSGISFLGDASPSDASPSGGWVNYSRPFVDEMSYEVIVEVGESETKIDWRSMRAVFYGVTKARISSLFQVVADKMNLPSNLPLGLMMSSGGASAATASPGNTPLSDDHVKIRIGSEAAILLDGREHVMPGDNMPGFSHPVSSSGEDHSAEDNSSNPSSASTTRSSTSRTQHSNAVAQTPPTKKRKWEARRGSLDEFGEWIVRRGQWRMRVQPREDPPMQQQSVGGTRGGGGGGLGTGTVPGGNGRTDEGGMEIILVAVHLDAVSGQRGRNAVRGFVGAS